jgi:hypothetical protein
MTRPAADTYFVERVVEQVVTRIVISPIGRMAY